MGPANCPKLSRTFVCGRAYGFLDSFRGDMRYDAV